MKNLKKVLSLVLALAMALSLMTAAFAKDASDYTDYGTITNKEAVEVMTALGVIDGMGDSFQPTGNVTRAQMAKMITIISLGNVDPTAFLGTQTDLKDINGHWAEAYIKYCYSQGIISGKGNGKFDPNANVTSAEASKMLLVAIGYNAKVQGYTGPQWAINVTRDAQKDGFYNGVSVPANQALTRDEAAQMIYNAIDTGVVVATPHWDSATGTTSYSYDKKADSDDLLSRTFNVVEHEGPMTYSAGTYDAAKGEYTYTVTDGDAGTTDTFKTTVDYTDLYQQNVKVLYKVNKDGTRTVYGIYPSSKGSVMATGLVADIKLVSGSTDKVKIGDTEYNLSDTTSSTNLVSFLAGTTLSALNSIDTYKGTAGSVAAAPRAFEMALIDNTGDNEADVIVVYPFTVEKVSYVGANSFTTGAVNGGAATGNKKFDDVVTYDGLAKDDYVKVTAAANSPVNKITYEKLDLVTAKAQAVKVTDGQIQFGGNWYKTDIVGTTKAEAGADSKYVAVNGYLFYLDANAVLTGVKDFAIVTKQARSTNGIDSTYTTELLKADGTKVVVEAVGPAATPGNLYKISENDDGYTVLTVVNKTNVTTSNSDFDVVFAQNTDPANQSHPLSTMSFTNASGSNKGYFTKTGTNAGTYYVNDDAVVFVYNTDGTGSYSVTTGARLKSTSTAVSNVIFAAAVDNSATGYTNIAVAYVITGSSVTTDAKLYGYVVDDTVKYEDGTNKYYTEIKFWDGSAVQTLKTKTVTGGTGVVATAYGLVKGDVFTYELNADGTIEKMTKYTAATMTSGATGASAIETAAVVAYADNMLKTTSDFFTSGSAWTTTTVTEDLKVTDDTVIIYVNSADTEGAEGGSIQLASSNSIAGVDSGNAHNYANVRYVAEADGDIVLLVVDVNNDILDIQ